MTTENNSTTQNHGSDRRQFERREVHTHALIEPLGVRPGSHSYTEVEVGDAGRTGVMFRSESEIPVGTSWRMWLVHRGEPFTSTPVVVRHCRPDQDGRFQIGAQFMLEPFFLARLMGITEESVMQLDDVSKEDRFADADMVA